MTKAKDSDSDSGILIQEVSNEADDDSDGILVTEVESDDDSDGILIEDVTAGRGGEESSEADDSDDDDDDDDDDDMPTIEEVEPPERSGPAGALRTGFLNKKAKAPPSKLELVRLKEEKRIAGNEEFKKKRFKPAVKLYTEAVDVDPYDKTLYANRAACHLALGDWRSAHDDAEECVKLDPTFVKGYFRLAHASRMLGQHDAALGAAKKGLDLEPNSVPLREEYALAKKDARRKDQVKAIKDDIHDLCAEMTPEERRWKAWWGGQGHPTCVNNTNLERYIPDCPIDVSYDAEVTQELHGPDNLPRLESDDEDDEDDLLLEEVLERLELDYLIPQFEDEGMGPRSFLTCARLPPLRPLLRHWLDESCGVDDASAFRRATALAETQARDCLEESWDDGADSLRVFPKGEGLSATYPTFSWRQRVREIELRVLLPPGCTGRDLTVKILPRRISVTVKREGLRFWPYERNAWTSIVDVGPQLPGERASTNVYGDGSESSDDDQPVVEEPSDDDMPAFDGDSDAEGDMDGLDPVGPEKAKGPGPSNADVFRAAKAKTTGAKQSAKSFEDLPGVELSDDDELEVEEMAGDSDEADVEEMPPLDGSESDEPEVEEMPPLDGSESEPEVEEMPPLDGSDSDEEPEIEEMPGSDDDDDLQVEELPMDDDDDDDDDLEVEELPMDSDDDDVEVEELPPDAQVLDPEEEEEPPEDDEDDDEDDEAAVEFAGAAPPRVVDDGGAAAAASRTPVVVKVKWVDMGLTLKAFEVTISNRRSVGELKDAVATVTGVPTDLMVIEYDGLVIDAQDAEFLGLVAAKKGIVTVSEASSADEAAAKDGDARAHRWAEERAAAAAAKAAPPKPAAATPKPTPAPAGNATFAARPAPAVGIPVADADDGGDDDKCAVDGAPTEITLLDFPTAHKLLVDDSIWHISKPRSCKGHALQAPILVMQLTKFQDFRRGTAQDAGQMWWRHMFVGANEECKLSHAPTEFYQWKDGKG